MTRTHQARFCVILALSFAALVPPALDPKFENADTPAWRPVQGRLTGLDYAPWPEPWAGSGKAALATARQLTERLQAAAAGGGPLAGARGAAMLHLQRGNLGEVVHQVERAMALTPFPDPDLASDLSALYLERSTKPEHAFDAVLALDSLARLPHDRAAQSFNLALALQHFGMRAAAERAWRDAARLEPGSPWATEATGQARLLATPPLETVWGTWRERLLAGQPVTGREIDDWALRLPGVLYDTVLYDLLGRWGTDCAPPNAESALCVRLLSTARVIALRLEERTGPDLGQAVQDLKHMRPEKLETLASGYASLAEGWRASERLDVEGAHRALEQAVSHLREGRSPVLEWAEYWLAATDLHRGRYAALREHLRRLAKYARDLRLKASIARTLGTAASRQLSLPMAERLYNEAIEQFSQAGDYLSAAIVRGYLSWVFFAQGRADEGWALAVACLDRLAQWPTGEYWPYLLNNAARAMIWQGRPAAGALLAEESARTLQRKSADAVEVAEAWLLLGHAQLAAGREGSARAALAPAEAAVAAIPDPSLRERMGAELALASGLVGTVPEDSVVALSRAVAIYEKRGLRPFLPAAYAARAHAYIALGDFGRAEEDLRSGIAESERAVAEFSDPLAAAPLAEVGQRLYDMAVALKLDHGQDEWAAFAIADRAKSAAIIRLHGAGILARPFAMLRPADVRKTLEPEEALVAFTQLEGRLLVSLMTLAGTEHRIIHVDADVMADHAARMLSLLSARGDAAAVRRESCWLFDHLLAPLRADLKGMERLILIPDRALNLVPFAALLDPRSGRFLVEDHSLAVMPSVQQVIGLRSRWSTRPHRETWRVGIVSTARIAAHESGLAALPAAESEVREVAALYQAPVCLVGRGATVSSFLALLPKVDVLHFAGHARGEPDAPWRARLWLAADGDHGRLETLLANRIVQEPLDHLELVLLSGCETALPSRRRTIGSDGLSAAFLARGAAAVVATLWRVDDAAVARVMIAIHQRLSQGDDVSAALRKVQLELLHSPNPAERDPGAWAFCQLAGLPVRRPGYTGGINHGLQSNPEVRGSLRERTERAAGQKPEKTLGGDA
jgi:CHAT domain-containing protein